MAIISNVTIIIPSKNYNDPHLLINKMGLNDFYKDLNIVFVFFGESVFADNIDYSNILVIENSNEGIYDSYNRAINKLSTDYYIVLGDDDKLVNKDLFINILSNVNLCLYDIYILGVYKYNKSIIEFLPSNLFKYIFGSFPSHSGGMIIKKCLHDTYGYYNLKYKRLADQLFFNTVYRAKISVMNTKATVFSIGSEGYSSNYLATLNELYLMNKEFNFLNKYILLINLFKLLILRIGKNIKDLFN